MELPEKVHEMLERAPTHLADHLVCAAPTGKGPFRDVYTRDGDVGREPLCPSARPCRRPTSSRWRRCCESRLSMHNIDPAAVYRPSAWASFGMDAEGQDYRACQTYGPLYG